MTDTIIADIVAAVSPFIDVYLSEAETEAYPYAVLSVVSNPQADKDGRVYKIVGSVELSLVSDDYDTVKTVSASLASALGCQVTLTYATGAVSRTTNCTLGIWTITLTYQHIQTA